MTPWLTPPDLLGSLSGSGVLDLRGRNSKSTVISNGNGSLLTFEVYLCKKVWFTSYPMILVINIVHTIINLPRGAEWGAVIFSIMYILTIYMSFFLPQVFKKLVIF